MAYMYKYNVDLEYNNEIMKRHMHSLQVSIKIG